MDTKDRAATVTPTDALREMAAECEKALAVRKTTVGARWCLERCRTALAAAEKDESELVAAVRKMRAKLHAHNRGGIIQSHLRDELRDDCDAALSKHAKKD